MDEETFDGGGYVKATIRDEGRFDAGNYSFFDFAAPQGGSLDGALEEGLEAPPAEERPLSGDGYGDGADEAALWDEGALDDDEDLSLAAVFRKQTLDDHDAIVSPPPKPARGAVEQVQKAPDAPPMPSFSKLVGSRAAPVPGAAGPALRQREHELAASSPAQPASPHLQHGLPGLPQELLPHTSAPFGSPPSQPPAGVSGLVLEAQQAELRGAGSPQRQSQLVSPGLGQPPPRQPAGALTAEQLEARMLSSAAAQHQQQQQPPPQQQVNGLLTALQAGPQQLARPDGAPMRPMHPLPPHMQHAPHMQPFPGMPLHPGMRPPPPGMPMRPGVPPSIQPGGMPMPPHMQPGMRPMGPPGRPLMGLLPPHMMAGPGGMPPMMVRPPPPPPGGAPLPPGQLLPGALLPPGARPMGPPGASMMHPLRPCMPPPLGGPPPHFTGIMGGPPVQPGVRPQIVMRPTVVDLAPPPPPPVAAGAPQGAAAPMPPGSLAAVMAQQQAESQHQPPVPRPPPALGQRPPHVTVAAGREAYDRQQAVYQSHGINAHHRRRIKDGKYMSAEEIEQILRIQWMATHSGEPYHEDYYHQAYIYKYLAGRNAALFAPQALRSLDDEALLSKDVPSFAKVQGLGKFVLSNIRTPKMLMDLGGEGLPGSNGAADEHGRSPGGRRLEQEPLLAARTMVEDCVGLLLDVDDVDRLFAAAAARSEPHPDAVILQRRRTLLLDAVIASLQLPGTPAGAPADGPGAEASVGDRVFLRVMALTKGRAFLAKTLRLLLPHHGPGSGAAARVPAYGQHIVWAILRNASVLFGPLGGSSATGGAGAEGDRRMVESTERLVGACAELIKRFDDPDAACSALEAFNAANAGGGEGGGGASALLPLFPAGRMAPGASPQWLGQLLAALLLRASELGLGSFAAGGGGGEGDGTEGVTPAVVARWAGQLAQLVHAMQHHLAALYAIKRGTSPGLPGLAPASYLVGLACLPMARSLMAHVEGTQREQLRGYLSELAH